jgi:hypothetical protein
MRLEVEGITGLRSGLARSRFSPRCYLSDLKRAVLLTLVAGPAHSWTQLSLTYREKQRVRKKLPHPTVAVKSGHQILLYAGNGRTR